MKPGLVGKKTRYSLVVSISTEAKDVSLYSSIVNEIRISLQQSTTIDAGVINL